MFLQVKELSEIAGVSVRTLHHYDAIGLLVPSSVTPAAYRLLDSPGFDRRKALKAHRELLLKKRERMDRMLETVDRTIRSIEGGTQMAKKDLFEGFDMEKIKQHQAKYSEEARQMFGKDVVEATERKINGYSEDKWKDIQTAMADICTTTYNRKTRTSFSDEVRVFIRIDTYINK